MEHRKFFLLALVLVIATGCPSPGTDSGPGTDSVVATDSGGTDSGTDAGSANPLIGRVYIQQGFTVGWASYHFDAEDDIYINWENSVGATYDNGQPLPDRKPFINTAFDLATRTFTANLDFSGDGSTVYGGEWVEYTMVFPADYSTIGGMVLWYDHEGGTVLGTAIFGVDLIYWESP